MSALLLTSSGIPNQTKIASETFADVERALFEDAGDSQRESRDNVSTEARLGPVHQDR
jgi:hypothetical protein